MMKLKKLISITLATVMAASVLSVGMVSCAYAKDATVTLTDKNTTSKQVSVNLSQPQQMKKQQSFGKLMAEKQLMVENLTRMIMLT